MYQILNSKNKHNLTDFRNFVFYSLHSYLYALNLGLCLLATSELFIFVCHPTFCEFKCQTPSLEDGKWQRIPSNFAQASAKRGSPSKAMQNGSSLHNSGSTERYLHIATAQMRCPERATGQEDELPDLLQKGRPTCGPGDEGDKYLLES